MAASKGIFRCESGQWGVTVNGETHIGYVNALAAINALDASAGTERGDELAAPRQKKTCLLASGIRSPLLPPPALTIDAAKDMIDKTLHRPSARSRSTIVETASTSTRGELAAPGQGSHRLMPREGAVMKAGVKCCEVLEKDGGMFGCNLPSGHPGPHFATDESSARSAGRKRTLSESQGPSAPKPPRPQTAKAAKASSSSLLPSPLTICAQAKGKTEADSAATAEPINMRTCATCGKVCLNRAGLLSHARVCKGEEAEEDPIADCPACHGKHRAHTCGGKGPMYIRSHASSAKNGALPASSDGGCSRQSTTTPAPPSLESAAPDASNTDEAPLQRKPRRDNAGKGVARLGWSDGWAEGAPGAWRSVEKRANHTLLTPRALPTLPEDQRERARLAIEKESRRLRSLSYAEIVLDKRDFLSAPAVHPRGGSWGTDWSDRVANTLRDWPVRNTFTLNSTVATNFGRVVGCTDFYFEVLYEDGFTESLGYRDLRPLLVMQPSKDAVLQELEKGAADELNRTSRRPARPRDMMAEAEAYLPRLGCHISLPIGKVACHLHEAIRQAGVLKSDPGPLASD